ncbi:Uncharacterized protein OBRU01_23919, partial [Operophtera brumata]
DVSQKYVSQETFNSIGALPKDFDVSGISALTQEKPQKGMKEKENNWQRDQVPTAKRKRAETSPLQNENAKKRPNNISYAVPTQNQFDILDDTEDTTNVEPPKPPKPEPIFVTGVIEVNSLKNVLKKITTNNNEYTMTKLRSGHIVKIMPTTIEVYKPMRQTFISENISHYTYKLKSERAYRVVLRGIKSTNVVVYGKYSTIQGTQGTKLPLTKHQLN